MPASTRSWANCRPCCSTEVTAPPNTADRHYRPEIDGLRAIAVLAVIANHFSKELLPSGYLGVDVFFVISGYVITASLARRPSNGLRQLLLGFYARRIRRLVPALLVCVLLTSLAICLVNPNPGLSLLTGATALFGVSNLYLHQLAIDYFGLTAEFNVFTQTWSLGVEEQFYLLYPLLVWATGFGRAGLARARPLALAVGGLSFASLLAFLWLSGRDPSGAYFLMPPRLWELGAGCLIALVLERAHSRSAALLRRLPALPLLLLLLPLLAAPLSAWVPATLAAVVLSVLLLACLQPHTPAWRLLCLPPLRWLGLISYSLYLWHWSVLSLSRWTIGIHGWTIPLQLLAMLLLAAGSYYLVETPLRQASWSASRIGTVLRGLGLAGAGSGLLLLLGATNERLFLGSARPDVAAAEQPKDCNVSLRPTVALFADPACLPRRGARPRLWLVGDSHAAQFLDAARSYRNGRFEVLPLSGRACLFPATDLATSHIDAACRSVQAAVARRLLAEVRRGDVVWIGTTQFGHFGGPGATAADSGLTNAAGQPLTHEQALERYRAALVPLAAELRRRGARVIVTLEGARFNAMRHPLQCVDNWFNRLDPARAGCRVPLAEVELSRRSIQAILAPQSPGRPAAAYELWDTLLPQVVCPDGLCRAQGLYADSNHYSRLYAARVFEALTRKHGL